jgi:hypothetical protein
MKRPSGSIRQSQIVTTFGPGAMVDLPRHSVIVGGLDDWSFGDAKRPVSESRLVAKLEALLGVRNLQLLAPPIESNEPNASPSGLTVWQFPEWFVAQYDEFRGGFRARPLVHRRGLVNERYQSRDGKRRPVVPVRFVQACTNGHISDIDWHGFVHEYPKEPCLRDLWMEERGTSGDLADVIIKCDCGKARSMAQATRRGAAPLGYCAGSRPWLGPAARERCGGEEGPVQQNRLLLRHASDAYFSQVLRVISIPDQDAILRAAVDKVWDDFLLYCESVEDVERERRKARVAAALEGHSSEKVFAEVRRRKGSAASPPTRSIKQAEIETLLASEDEIGEDAPQGADFYARRMPLPADPVLAAVERVVLVHRLREVMALVGFTRFEPAIPDIEGELSLDVRRAPLSRDASWLPAVENRGEGFFVAFRREAVQGWLARPAVQERAEKLLGGFGAWQHRNAAGERAQFPGLPYVLLHSLSHLLITAVSLECGYAASSIRERVYAGESGYGILLYTGTPDAEGTLGGLVEVGRRIERHLGSALGMARLCSNDPVCAAHRPDKHHEERFLHGAACHGCLLIAEPSCERRNEFLDRALVVATVEGPGAEFFAETAP